MTANVALGDFLRARRSEVSPESVGLAAVGSYRRVAGLRREEVAQLTGVSTDYYTRLEQGRHTSPSPEVLDAISEVLRLDSTARRHLDDLVGAGRRRRTTLPRQRVRPGVLRMMDTLEDQAAFVLGRRTDVLAANRLARALLADFHAMPARERNLTRWILLDPAARELYLDWRTIASEMTAILRLDAGRYPDDPRTADLVGELAVKSEDFNRWWGHQKVLERGGGSKRFHHPVVGDLAIDYEAMILPADPDQTLFVYTAQPGASQEAMRLLASWSLDSPGVAITDAPDRPAAADSATPAAMSSHIGRSNTTG
ncbi:helix-turn-helix transcriptional regulator [Actinomycetospora termitidis]|uniref:Helix-turn-helix transcriptional regulator n=1 Tax=Actinomycetospora termitidis TaxID=3053470 RepID=A0ABT7M6B5_9PSEU|nr:helix-turn-helix transcriptional regulator [Actinomycetospora sp. Odt1-22]MDL5156218.1 helix-turn-helix transcriptional regulator [Actinomycetospora sp. Odt1-22]